jgi:hypothetical protein
MRSSPDDPAKSVGKGPGGRGAGFSMNVEPLSYETAMVA